MGALATLGLRTGLATFAILSMMATAEALMSRPYLSPLPSAALDPPIWTTHPVRVDRSAQKIEITPDLFPFKFKGARHVRVWDNATFVLLGETMLIQDIDRLDAKALCRDARDRLFACGAIAQAKLRAILQRSYVECSRRPVASRVYLVNCHSGGRSLVDRMKDPASSGLSASLR